MPIQRSLYSTDNTSIACDSARSGSVAHNGRQPARKTHHAFRCRDRRCFSRGESMSRTDRLSVEDRIAIQDLIARYAWALDTGDVDAFVACFTPDCVVIEEVFEEPDRWEGHVGVRRLAEHYRNAPGFPGRQHHVSQSIVTGAGDRCTVKSFAFVTECRGEPPYTLRFAGY